MASCSRTDEKHKSTESWNRPPTIHVQPSIYYLVGSARLNTAFLLVCIHAPHCLLKMKRFQVLVQGFQRSLHRETIQKYSDWKWWKWCYKLQNLPFHVVTTYRFKVIWPNNSPLNSHHFNLIILSGARWGSWFPSHSFLTLRFRNWSPVGYCSSVRGHQAVDGNLRKEIIFVKVKCRNKSQMRHRSSTLWVSPQSSDVWISASGPAGRRLGSEKQLNTQAEALHCTELYWSVTVAEGGERERAKEPRVYPPPCHLCSTLREREREREKEAILAAEQIQSKEKEEWAAGNRHTRIHLGGEEAAEREKGKEQHTHQGWQMEFGGRYSFWFGAEPDIPARIEGDSSPCAK